MINVEIVGSDLPTGKGDAGSVGGPGGFCSAGESGGELGNYVPVEAKDLDAAGAISMDLAAARRVPSGDHVGTKSCPGLLVTLVKRLRLLLST